MERRTFILTATSVGIVGLAGCTGDDDGDGGDDGSGTGGDNGGDGGTDDGNGDDDGTDDGDGGDDGTDDGNGGDGMDDGNGDDDGMDDGNGDDGGTDDGDGGDDGMDDGDGDDGMDDGDGDDGMDDGDGDDGGMDDGDGDDGGMDDGDGDDDGMDDGNGDDDGTDDGDGGDDGTDDGNGGDDSGTEAITLQEAQQTQAIESSFILEGSVSGREFGQAEATIRYNGGDFHQTISGMEVEDGPGSAEIYSVDGDMYFVAQGRCIRNPGGVPDPNTGVNPGEGDQTLQGAPPDLTPDGRETVNGEEAYVFTYNLDGTPTTAYISVGTGRPLRIESDQTTLDFHSWGEVGEITPPDMNCQSIGGGGGGGGGGSGGGGGGGGPY